MLTDIDGQHDNDSTMLMILMMVTRATSNHVSTMTTLLMVLTRPMVRSLIQVFAK